jgi:Tol biopolymer transport system component
MFERKRSKASRRSAVPTVRLSLERLEARETPATLQPLTQPDGGTIDVFRAGRISFSFSADGRYVAFEHMAGIYVRDGVTGTMSRIDVATDGGLPNEQSASPSISADGRFVAFCSWASNLVPNDTNGRGDVFVYDRQTGTTMLASVGPDGKQLDPSQNLMGAADPSISADGRFVAFVMGGSVLAGPPPWDPLPHAYLFDRLAGTASLIDVSTTRWLSGPASISADGRFIATGAVINASGWALYARETGTIRLIEGPEGVYMGIGSPSISADGRYVALLGASATPSGRTGYSVYVYDVQTGDYSRISGPSESRGTPTISAGGRFVAFAAADDSVPGYSGSRTDVFIYDRQTNTYTLVSDGIDGDSGYAVISPNGQLVAFEGSSNAPGPPPPFFPAATVPWHRSFLYTSDNPADIHDVTTFARDASAPHSPFAPMLAITLPHSGGMANLIGWDLSGDGTADFVILTRRVHQRWNVTAFDLAAHKPLLHFDLTRPRQMPQFFSALVHLNRDSLLGLLNTASPLPVEPFGLFSTALLLASA